MFPSLFLYVAFFFQIFPVVTCIHFFFFNDTATTEIYTLSLHDALPILHGPARVGLSGGARAQDHRGRVRMGHAPRPTVEDRKSTRLNSSHVRISYAVFCLKNKTDGTFVSLGVFLDVFTVFYAATLQSCI